jgi:hypothetical protein
MNLSLWQKTNPVPAGFTLVMAISKKSAPAIIVAYYELPGTYTGQTQLHTFTGLQNVLYYYQLFLSPDHGADGTVENYFDVQPNVNAYNVRDNAELTADISPFLASETNFYGVDSSLVGWNWYLERKGTGTLYYGTDWTKTKAGVNTTKDDLDADGWKLLVAGDLIGNGEEFVIHFYPQLQATSTPQASTMISQTTMLTSNTTLTNSAAGQAFILQGGGGYFQVNVPDITTVPDSVPIFFNSAGGNHINVGISAFAGQMFEWYSNQTNLGSTTRSTILYLGQCENIWIMRFTYPDGSKRWQVFGDTDGIRQVGEIIYDWSKIPLNTVLLAGQTLSRTNYARLWAWVQNLEAACLISDGSFNATTTLDGIQYFTNRGKFTTGDGSTTFRIPLITSGSGTGTGFLRFVDGSTRLPGSLQSDAFEDHQHETTIGTLSSSLFGKGFTRDKGNYNGHASGQTDLTSLAGLVVGSTFQASQKTSYETRPVNIGAYGLIRV